MRKGFLILLCLFAIGFNLMAQKFSYVDTQYILENIPDYKSAQQQLDKVSQNWQKEIEAKFAEIDRMNKDFQAESVLLTDEMKKKREEEIAEKEKAAKELQKQRFGKGGDLFKKRQELIKPIQDKIYNAIKEIATTKNYAVVFDKSSDLTMLFTNPKYDISNLVLDNMGLSSTKRSKSSDKENNNSDSPVLPPK